MVKSPTRSLRARPPMTLLASSTVTRRPALARRYAAVSPAGPAPTTTQLRLMRARLSLYGRGDPAAVVAGADPSLREQPVEMLCRRAAFGGVDVCELRVRRVEEAMGDHVVERVRGGEKREHRLLALGDAGGEALELGEKLAALGEHADVMERYPGAGRQLAHARQRALEIVQAGPGVAVVRPEA